MKMACEKHGHGTDACMYKCQWRKEETGMELEGRKHPFSWSQVCPLFVDISSFAAFVWPNFLHLCTFLSSRDL